MNTAQFIITLLGSGSLPGSIFGEYQTYVLADGGTVEAPDCTINAIASLL
jgi:hypothetical protein